jgi:DNA adenine methylase
MQDLFPESKWQKILGPQKTIHSTKDTRQEVLWINYPLPESQSDSNSVQRELF